MAIPESYRVEHLFLLVGGNPLPCFISAQLLLQGGLSQRDDSRCPGLYLVHTDETKTVAARLVQSLRTEGMTFREQYISVDEADSRQIYAEVRACVVGKQSVGLNYTGGTKAMAVHSYRAVESATPSAVFSYLDATTLEMVLEQEPQPPLFVDVSLQAPIRIERLLQLHGRGLCEQPVAQPGLSEQARALALSDHGQLTHWARVLVNEGGFRQPTELLGVRVPTGPWTSRIAPFWQGCQTLGDVARQRDIPIIQLAGWLHGKWLEDYVLWAVQQVASDCQVHESVKSVKPSSPSFEFDVVAMRGHQLFALSCTTSAKKERNKEHLFEAYIRARQMGGFEARVGLVCCLPPSSNPSNNPRLMQAELEEVWHMGDRIRVFGSEHLHELSKHLADWFTYRIVGG